MSPKQNVLGKLHDFIASKVTPKAPQGYEGLLSQEEIQGAKPGILSSIFGSPKGAGAHYSANLNRVLEMKGMASNVAEQKRIKESRAKMAEMFPLNPNATHEETMNRLEGMFAYAAQTGDLELAERLKGYAANAAMAQKPPAARNPIAGSEEWKEAERFKASLRPQGGSQDKTLVQTQNPDGSVVYTPRSEAAGMNAPSPVARGSAAVMQKVADNKTQMSVIDDALKDLAAHPSAVGMKRGLGEMIPFMGNAGDAINQRMDPDGVLARAGIMDIGSLKIKDRSGAAVTISEFPRLAPFVPRVSDTPAAVRIKLMRLKHFIKVETDLLAASAGKDKGTVPSYEEWLASQKK
jgi:hypothetical protein